MCWNSDRQIHFLGSNWSRGDRSNGVVSDMKSVTEDGKLAGTELNGENANGCYG